MFSKYIIRIVFFGLFTVLTLTVFSTSIFADPVISGQYWVATNGDVSNNGSYNNPWPSISYAIGQVPLSGGFEIVVKDGVYDGRSLVDKKFQNWVLIRAENDYKAILKNTQPQNLPWDAALAVQGDPGAANVIIKGFEITNDDPGHSCTTRRSFAVLFTNMSNITLQNNIIHGNTAPETCNDLIKINRRGGGFPRNIKIVGNVIYDPAPLAGDDLIDSVMAGEIDIWENIFFSRNTDHGSQSFITLKDQIYPSHPDYPDDVRSPRFTIKRNVFLNWDGKPDQAFVQFGEDEYVDFMISDSVIENNLFIGNSPYEMSAPVQLKGVANITVRANTITGDFQNSRHGARIGSEGSNPASEDIFFYNNIFSDPLGTMDNEFVNGYNSFVLSSFEINNNLYWNNGNSLPSSGILTPVDDTRALEANPLLETDQSGIVLPVWDAQNSSFLSGSTTIRKEFERLVNNYGAIPSDSPARDSADPSNMPPDDILGTTRDVNPDIGAFEYSNGTQGSCEDSSCDAGDNCSNYDSLCPDNSCTEPSCSNGCQALMVGFGNKDETCLGNNYCDGSGVCVVCDTNIETNCNGRIDNSELLLNINKWYNSQFSISELMQAIKYWKAGRIE